MKGDNVKMLQGEWGEGGNKWKDQKPRKAAKRRQGTTRWLGSKIRDL